MSNETDKVDDNRLLDDMSRMIDMLADEIRFQTENRIKYSDGTVSIPEEIMVTPDQRVAVNDVTPEQWEAAFQSYHVETFTQVARMLDKLIEFNVAKYVMYDSKQNIADAH